MLKAALIGVGGFGYCHLLSFRKLAEEQKVQLVAACDVNPKYRNETEQNNIVFYEKYTDMLENHPELDYVTISTPIHTHVEIAGKCLEKGFHILLEKPPAILPEEWRHLKALQEKSQKACALNYTMTADPAYLDLYSLIQNNKLGKIEKIIGFGLYRRFQSYFSSPWIGNLWHQNYLLRDGTINNSLSHLLNNMIQLGKANEDTAIHSVQAELYHANAITGDDTSCIRIHLANGTILLFYATLCHSVQEPARIEVFGTKGNAVWHYPCHLTGSVTEAKFYPHMDNQTDLIHENLYLHLTQKRPLFSSLDSCKDTVLAADAAFRSASNIAEIPLKYTKKHGESGETGIALTNINHFFDIAAKNNALLSEIDCPWAISTKKVIL